CRARVLSNGGYQPEAAESFAHARRVGLEGIVLAIVAPDGPDASDAAAVEEIRPNSAARRGGLRVELGRAKPRSTGPRLRSVRFQGWNALRDGCGGDRSTLPP